MKNTLTVFTCLVLLWIQLYAEEETLDSIEQRLVSIENDFSSVEAKYLSPLVLKANYKEPSEEKIKRAEYYFKVKDYITSGSLYYSIYSSSKKRSPVWEESLHKLAESLFLNKNYISAVRYYELLFAEYPDTKYKISLLKRLISSSYKLGEYSKAKNYYVEFQNMDYKINQDSELMYYLGKALFYDSQNKEALEIFLLTDETSAYYPQSLYFLGAIKLAEAKTEESIAFFKKIIDQKNVDSFYLYDRVKNLAVLALGRIYFEKDDYENAVEYYLQLDRKSTQFIEGYYELCWTYIKRESYNKAIEALRLLKMIAPDSIFSPKAALLEGNLLIKVRKFGEAMLIFDASIKKYEKISEQLDGVSFGKESTLDNENLLMLSPVVRNVFKNDKKIEYAIRLQSDIKFLEKEMSQIVTLDKKFEAVLENNNISMIFKPLKKGSAAAVTMQNELVSIRNKLLQVTKNLISKDLNDEQEKEFDRLAKEKDKLRKKIDKMPLTNSELNSLSDAYAKRLIEADKKLHRINLTLSSYDKQLGAMSAFQTRAAKKSKLFEKKVIEEKAFLEQMKVSYGEVKQEIEEEKNRYSLGGKMIKEIVDFRHKYEKLIIRQNKLLRGYRDPATSLKVKLLEDKIDRLSKRGRIFTEKLNKVVSAIVLQIKTNYFEEKRKIDSYKSNLLVLKIEASNLGAETMFSNIDKVKKAFSDIVLKADVGIIDVAWEKKQQSTDKLIDYRTKMAEEVRQLYLNLENIE